MKGSWRNKLNSLKETVKQSWDRASEEDKARLKSDIKNRNYKGIAGTLRENLKKEGKV